MITAAPKHYQDTKAYGFDWREWLNGEDQIQTSWWSVSPAGLTVVDYVSTADRTYVWLAGGTAGTSYSVTNTITTLGGRVDQRTFVLPVRNLGSRIEGAGGVAAVLGGTLSDVPLFSGAVGLIAGASGTLTDAPSGPFIFTDDFNRADGVLGSDWDVSPAPPGGVNANGGIEIASNSARLASGSIGTATVSAGVHTFAADRYVKAKSVAWNSNAHGLILRGATQVRWSSTLTLRVYNAVAAFDTGVSVALNDVIELSVVGSGLTLKKNGVSVWTGTENVPASGQPGLLMTYSGSSLTSTRMDDFEAGEIV